MNPGGRQLTSLAGERTSFFICSSSVLIASLSSCIFPAAPAVAPERARLANWPASKSSAFGTDGVGWCSRDILPKSGGCKHVHEGLCVVVSPGRAHRLAWIARTRR